MIDTFGAKDSHYGLAPGHNRHADFSSIGVVLLSHIPYNLPIPDCEPMNIGVLRCGIYNITAFSSVMLDDFRIGQGHRHVKKELYA